ncbi:MAG: cbb3-type cytochrome oxidase assembly protein CcoS [Flavobacteriales bacterium]|nr:cbb3-type cytochrome oxidase assembly protein CcoS [Flavobacteriales bacterium]MBK6754707.1 cbb3-type cytochrome oxidase assembly protein CcoS [Flavobacteriales bacterium]MBK7086222.1 cbb3-type cytochrome oxidase assembly protein CcoS [Flavobacteriales bacterium]MBK7271348.1 cbb3-type cytochrome oxidase assembly protein CcoS [Flavobacteriales bacterium]MBK7754645.1 cbb3-type cytochrome oxidase assembly protein CcoS [Flavobacteriales bacterium]
MSVIFLLIAASTLVAGIFLAAFVWAVRKGQYDDDRSPAVRMLHDPSVPQPLSKAEGTLPLNEIK